MSGSACWRASRKCGAGWPMRGRAKRRAAPRRSFRIFWKDRWLMYRKFCALPGALAASVLLAIAPTSLAAQERRAGSPIDVQGYTVEAEITPSTQSLAAKAEVRFVPLVDNLTSASFELNNALNIARVVDGQGKQIPASRNSQDFSVRLAFDPPLAKGQPVSITFDYDGKLSGQEDSPVEGIRFAAINPDYAFL